LQTFSRDTRLPNEENSRNPRGGLFSELFSENDIMKMREVPVMFKRAFLFAPVLLCGFLVSNALAAQVPKVPEKIDKALRARVTEFFQYHVDGTFKKALDLVADETQDEYFNSAKIKLKSFKLDDIKYSDKFDKATVTTTITRDWEIRMQNNVVTLPMVTTWKLEHGKWVWYHNKQGEWLTPMGPSDYKAITKNADGTLNVPKINQDTVAEAAKSIMNSTGADKLDVRFEPGKKGSDQVVFRNGAMGEVQLEMTPIDPVPGLTFKFDKLNVAAGKSAALSFQYEPQEKTPPAEVQVPFTVIPFNITYVVIVHFPPEGQ
jgi:hypothetical protein